MVKTLCDLLFQDGIQLITKIKKNMKNTLIPIRDKILLRHRAIIETVNDELKNISQIDIPGIDQNITSLST